MGNESATSLKRALAIMLVLESDEALAEGGLGVVQIARLTGREKSQVSRSLKALAELGLVDRNPGTLTYRLGWRLLALAARAGEQRLLEAAQPVLRRLVRTLGEAAHLSVLQGGEVLTVLSESPMQAVRAVGWVGRTVPASCTSSGRALLLDHELDDLLALWPAGDLFTGGPNAPTDVEDLYRRITHARRQGYVAVDEELEPGLLAVAAPIRDTRGHIVAALDVSAPKFRFRDRLKVAGAEVKSAAQELSRLLDTRAHTQDELGKTRLPAAVR